MIASSHRFVCSALLALSMSGAGAQEAGSRKAPVETLEELSKVDANTRALAIKVDSQDHTLLDEIVARFPDLEELRIAHPGSNMHIENFKSLQKLKRLRSLDLAGDPFLSDEKFALLGSLKNLRSLKLALP
jgi:hypothetical protein